MRRQYLHVTDIGEVGAICLSCGHGQSKATVRPAAHVTFHQFQWEPPKAIDAEYLVAALLILEFQFVGDHFPCQLVRWHFFGVGNGWGSAADPSRMMVTTMDAGLRTSLTANGTVRAQHVLNQLFMSPSSPLAKDSATRS